MQKHCYSNIGTEEIKRSSSSYYYVNLQEMGEKNDLYWLPAIYLSCFSIYVMQMIRAINVK